MCKKFLLYFSLVSLVSKEGFFSIKCRQKQSGSCVLGFSFLRKLYIWMAYSGADVTLRSVGLWGLSSFFKKKLKHQFITKEGQRHAVIKWE